MYAGAGIHVVVDGPIRALAAISERSGNFFETWIEGEIVSHGILADGGADEHHVWCLLLWTHGTSPLSSPTKHV